MRSTSGVGRTAKSEGVGGGYLTGTKLGFWANIGTRTHLGPRHLAPSHHKALVARTLVQIRALPSRLRSEPHPLGLRSHFSDAPVPRSLETQPQRWRTHHASIELGPALSADALDQVWAGCYHTWSGFELWGGADPMRAESRASLTNFEALPLNTKWLRPNLCVFGETWSGFGRMWGQLWGTFDPIGAG